ncbi:MAG TPA: hypothetical protein VIK32_00510 [Candidatus Limnocylindrales bacterium]
MKPRNRPGKRAALPRGRGLPAPLRGAIIGFATLFAALGRLLWLLTLATVPTDFVDWWLPPLLICFSVAAPFGVLLWPARQPQG